MTVNVIPIHKYYTSSIDQKFCSYKRNKICWKCEILILQQGSECASTLFL